LGSTHTRLALSTSRARSARVVAILAITLFISYAYFYQAGGWNQNSRFDLVRAMLERGTLRIDAYAQNTGDKATFDGHVYSDKAPGQALASVPAVAAGAALIRATGGDPTSDVSLALLAYVATIWASGVPTVIAAIAVAYSARRLGASLDGALVAALGLGLGSPAWVYASLLWGHALAAGCLAAAFAGAIALRESGSQRRDTWLSLLVGAACGWAVVTEYPAGPAAIFIGVLAVVHSLRGGWRRARMVASISIATGLIAILLLATYNALAFGSPFQVGYAGVQGFGGMSEGIFGVTFPRRTVLEALVFGSFRGLVPLAPASLPGLVGLALLFRERTHRAAALTAAAIVVYYFLFNASYYYWSGGFSYGPRHVGAALPFMFVGLGYLWTVASGVLRALILVLLVWGIALSLMAVSTIVMLPEDVASPITHLVVPAFASGDLASNRQSFLQYGDAVPAQGLLGAWNVGQLLGLRGAASLIPLYVVWLLALVALRSVRQRSNYHGT
jgi:4-amino-4-deoxy-L-arabinose transferase-like glycosyltransferase